MVTLVLLVLASGDGLLTDAERSACSADLAALEITRNHHADQATIERFSANVRRCVAGFHAGEELRARAAEKQKQAMDAIAKRQEEAALAERESAGQVAEAAVLAKDPKRAVPAISSIICFNLAIRASHKAAIDEELKYAREGGGVIDKDKVHDYQDGMKLGDKTNAAWVKLLAERFKAKPIPCGKKLDALAETDAVRAVTPRGTEGEYVQVADVPWFVDFDGR